jgi:hypothetical protein
MLYFYLHKMLLIILSNILQVITSGMSRIRINIIARIHVLIRIGILKLNIKLIKSLNPNLTLIFFFRRP